MVARRRTHVAQRQPVFDERGSSVSLTGMQCDRVLADRAAERFRVHAIALNRLLSSIDAAWATRLAWCPGRRRERTTVLTPAAGWPPAADVRKCDLPESQVPPAGGTSGKWVI